MMIARKGRIFAALVAVVFAVSLAGCDDDKGPSTPEPEEEFGTIVIDQTPDELTGAGWSLTGPQAETDSGDTTFTEMPTGLYTLTWDAVGGYATPPSEELTLDGDGSIMFNGTYAPEGSIVIDQTPDVVDGAGWTLTGPQNETGSGDITLPGMPAGSYTLTWDVLSDCTEPDGDTGDLVAGGTIIFSGTYVYDPEPSGGFVLIRSGSFMMGSPIDEYYRYSHETMHSVTLTTAFYISTTEVTNQQYADMAQWAYDRGYCTATSDSLINNLDGSTKELLELDNPYCEISFSEGTFSVDNGREDCPVIYVSWYGAAAYCDWLSLYEGLIRAYDHSTWLCHGNDPYSAQGYRLPTEAEWEYACRAWTDTPFNTGECLDAGTEANYNGNYPYIDCPSGPYEDWPVAVGSYQASPWSLYDMHGNVFEWCNDWFGDYGGSETDPAGPSEGLAKVIRGGLWYYNASICRSAARDHFIPAAKNSMTGFRPVRSAY